MERRQYNWIRTINALYDYLAGNPISPRAVALYHYFLYTFSRSRWPEWVRVSNMTLAAGCSMSLASVKRARDELLAARLIEYASETGSRSPQYRLVPPTCWWDGITVADADGIRATVQSELMRDGYVPFRPDTPVED